MVFKSLIYSYPVGAIKSKLRNRLGIPCNPMGDTN